MQRIRLRGRVVSGLGEGARYVELYRRVFNDHLGIDPYPGTLNIDVGFDASTKIPHDKALVLPPPFPGLGKVLVYPGYLEYVKVFIIKPVVTKHSWRILEVISNIYLRGELDLKDGDEVELVIMV